MPKIEKSHIGQVFLREIEPRKWRASWTDPLTKRHIRRILPAAAYREAEEQVKAINRTLAQGKGFGGQIRGSSGHTIREAVLEAVRHTGANEDTRLNYLHRFNPFAAYLETHAKGIAAWAEVSEQVIGNYIEHCRREGCAHDSIRLRLYLLRLTSASMSRTYPGQYRHVTAHVRLKRIAPTAAELNAKDAILTPGQLRGLLAWLSEAEPMVHVWATLQGLAGLRLLEVAYMREQDFDPKARTVTITKSEAHAPKNRSSYRTIPICPASAEAIGNWIAGLRIRHPLGYLFFPAKGATGRAGAKSDQARIGVFTRGHISHIWQDALRAMRRDGVMAPELCTARKLRSTFATAMRTAGADFEVLQHFIGHAPSSVLGAHYDVIGLDRLASVATLAQDLYDGRGAFAIEPIEARINGA